jgi:hypothetical protein
VSDGRPSPRGRVRFPWDTLATPAPPPADRDPDAPTAKPKPRGRRPTTAIRAVAADDAPDWRFHHLTISGPAAAVDDFAAAARGSGVTPWELDYTTIEEDIFVRAVSQPASRRTLTVAGCRILARQFREKIEVRQARAAALVGQSGLCPFDLHTLLPVPDRILHLGPTHPAALAWLAAHWGVTDRLRQVAVRNKATTGRRLPAGHTVIGYSFFTHRETPDAAIGQLAVRWPTLRFALQHRPLD